MGPWRGGVGDCAVVSVREGFRKKCRQEKAPTGRPQPPNPKGPLQRSSPVRTLSIDKNIYWIAGEVAARVRKGGARGAGSSRGWGLLFLVGGWRWPHSDPNSPTPPPGPGNTETPHQGQRTALDQRTYDQEEGARSTEGLPWRALGRGPRVVVAAGG